MDVDSMACPPLCSPLHAFLLLLTVFLQPHVSSLRSRPLHVPIPLLQTLLHLPMWEMPAHSHVSDIVGKFYLFSQGPDSLPFECSTSTLYMGPLCVICDITVTDLPHPSPALCVPGGPLATPGPEPGTLPAHSGCTWVHTQQGRRS